MTVSFCGFVPIRNLSKNIPSKFFISTPIYYVNANPHIGHLYSSVIADCIQRWKKIYYNDKIKIKFSTGTDEHGLKIQQAAEKNNNTLSQYCKEISLKYKHLADYFNVNYTDFIRTSDDYHKENVHKFWEILDKNGFIYSKKYEGWYCISDETFLTESQLKEITLPDGKKIIVSLESGHPVEWSAETNYMFRLSSLHKELKYWLQHNENFVKPKKFHKILIDMVDDNLPDISISRPTSRVHWGISVPGDRTQTIYVWMDALVNYLSVSGYLQIDNGIFQEIWPPDVQVIGKDILKFHGIYWPCFLMAAKMDLSHTLLCHSHWTVDGEKMSKSKNNVVCPFDVSKIFSSDGLRYFLLREGVAHSDGNYSNTKIIRILNSELADTLGNLLNRCCGNILNPDSVFPRVDISILKEIAELDTTKRLIESTKALPDVCFEQYENYNFHKVADNIRTTLHLANLFFENSKPWELRKNPEKNEHLNVILHITMDVLRITGILLQPLIPNISTNLLNKLNIPINERYFNNLKKFSWEIINFQQKQLNQNNCILFKKILSEKKIKRVS